MDNLGYVPDENGRVFAVSRYPSNPYIPNDYLVAVNSRAKIFKKPEFFKRLSLLLCIVAIVFLIALIILIVLYVKRRPKVCTTDECLRAAANFKYSIDFTVDPCDDFYQFTCGNWAEEHPNHGWYASFSTFSTIDEKLSIHQMKFFESEPDKDVQEPEAVVKARNMYKSCMDVEALNNLGVTVLMRYLNETGLPIIPSIFTKTEEEQQQLKFDWLKVEAQLKKTFGMDVFFGFQVSANLYNISENVIYLGTPGAKSPLPSPIKQEWLKGEGKDRDKSKNDEESSEEEYEVLVRQTRSNIVKYVVQGMMRNNSMEEPDAAVLELAAEIINNVTDYIKEMSKNYTSHPNSYDVYKKSIPEAQTTINLGLTNLTSNKYPDFYLTYINHVFNGTNVTIDPDTDYIYFYDPEEQYMPIMLAYILQLSDVQRELYLWWTTVYAMIMNTSTDIAEYIAIEVAPFYGDRNVYRFRSLECSNLVGSYMGMAVSYILADVAFKDKTRPKVQRMIQEIKAAFEEELSSIQWMDKETKKVTLEKCEETLSFIGYPDWLFKNGSIDYFYRNVELKPDTFLENMIKIIQAEAENLNDLRVPNGRNWTTEPNTVNAYNSFFDNAINVPMAILNFPMYNLGLEVLNYGSIGAILGHELTHGFDNSGRKHDKYGNYIQWWSNKTIETFEEMTQCFVTQYDNFTLEGVEGHVDGKKTLGENLADNGGLNQAFKAYAKYVKDYGEEDRLPGFEDYSPYQLFFIAYGSIWCESASKDDLKDQLEYDEHAPNPTRVIGTLQNSEAFAEVFKCKKGSNMNPDRKKCKIW